MRQFLPAGRLVCLLLLAWLAGCAPANEEQPITPSATPTVTYTPRIGVAFATVPPPTIAIAQITPSPLPTATPTATPTPIVYQVQTGDTIWSIAYLNGTIPDDVLALNPAVRPELLQIGQSLVLPPPATPIFGDTRGTPVPLNVVVTDVRLYRTAAGGAWLIGELRNDGDRPAESVQVTALLAGAGGTPLGSTVAWAAQSIIAGGARAPFAARLAAVAEDAQVTATSITAGASAVNLGDRSFALDVRDVALAGGDGRATVSGLVANADSVPLAQVALTVTLYDATGAISGFSQIVLPDVLAPGAEQPFSLMVAPPGAPPVTAAVSAQGLRQTPSVDNN